MWMAPALCSSWLTAAFPAMPTHPQCLTPLGPKSSCPSSLMGRYCTPITMRVPRARRIQGYFCVSCTAGLVHAPAQQDWFMLLHISTGSCSCTSALVHAPTIWFLPLKCTHYDIRVYIAESLPVSLSLCPRIYPISSEPIIRSYPIASHHILSCPCWASPRPRTKLIPTSSANMGLAIVYTS